MLCRDHTERNSDGSRGGLEIRLTIRGIWVLYCQKYHSCSPSLSAFSEMLVADRPDSAHLPDHGAVLETGPLSFLRRRISQYGRRATGAVLGDALLFPAGKERGVISCHLKYERRHEVRYRSVLLEQTGGSCGLMPP